MRQLPKGPFFAGLLLSLAIAIAISAVMVAAESRTLSRGQPTSSAAAFVDRVDTNQLVASPGPAGPPVAASAGPGIPQHGPLLFDFSSMLASSHGQVPATVGNQQLDKVQVSGQSLQFEVSPTSRAMIDLPSSVEPSSFVAVMDVDLLSGVGAFTFTFHMAQQGEQQHAVQVYSDGTTEAVLFDGTSGARSLFQPSNKVPALAGPATLTVAVNGPTMKIYVNGVEAGSAEDGTLSQGSMGFKAAAGARGGPFVLRLTGLKVYQAA